MAYAFRHSLGVPRAVCDSSFEPVRVLLEESSSEERNGQVYVACIQEKTAHLWEQQYGIEHAHVDEHNKSLRLSVGEQEERIWKLGSCPCFFFKSSSNKRKNNVKFDRTLHNYVRNAKVYFSVFMLHMYIYCVLSTVSMNWKFSSNVRKNNGKFDVILQQLSISTKNRLWISIAWKSAQTPNGTN